MVKKAELDMPKWHEKDSITVSKYGKERYGRYGGKQAACPVVHFDALEWLEAQIENKTRANWDQVILITGEERVGKSTLASHLARRLSPDLEPGDIAWNGYQFLKRSKESSKGSVVWLDEAGASLFHQEWWNKVQRKIVKAFQIFGKKELRVILVLPHRSLLNKQLRNRRIHWWLHCYTQGNKRGFARLRKPSKSEWNPDAFWKGQFTLTFPKVKGDWWDEYEDNKDEFIQKSLAEEGLNQHEKKNKKRLYNLVYDLCEGNKDYRHKDIAQMLGTTRQWVTKIVKNVREDPDDYEIED